MLFASCMNFDESHIFLSFGLLAHKIATTVSVSQVVVWVK